MKDQSLLSFFTMLLLPIAFAIDANAAERPRVIVLTDMKGPDSGRDLDDVASMVRLLVYANEFQIEGLIAGRACSTADNDGPSVTRPDVIHEMIDRYASAYPNLCLHAEGFPTPEQMHAVVRRGAVGDPSQPCWKADSDMLAVGEGKSTAASRWIIDVVDRDDSRPVWILGWGKVIDLAQALYDVRATRSKTEIDAFVAKLRVYDVWGQCECGGWIANQFPGIFWIRSREQIKGMSNPPGDTSNIQEAWLKKHVRTDHGRLGEYYPPRSMQAGNVEGDSPSFLYLLQNGLSDPEMPGWGSWGGRMTSGPVKNVFAIGKPPIDREWTDFMMFDDTADREWMQGLSDRFALRAPLNRWREHFQNDFRARMDWCVSDRDSANHAPVVILNGDRSVKVVIQEAKVGQVVSLSAEGSFDPDDDPLSFRWYRYTDADSCDGKVELESADSPSVSFVAPELKSGEDVHIICECTDMGTPSLTRYRRFVLRPKT